MSSASFFQRLTTSRPTTRRRSCGSGILGRSFEDVGLAIVRGSPTRNSNGYTVVAIEAREAAARQSARRISDLKHERI